jgi:hypothetical protein
MVKMFFMLIWGGFGVLRVLDGDMPAAILAAMFLVSLVILAFLERRPA